MTFPEGFVISLTYQTTILFNKQVEFLNKGGVFTPWHSSSGDGQ